jgi:hypothetical protein
MEHVSKSKQVRFLLLFFQTHGVDKKLCCSKMFELAVANIGNSTMCVTVSC